MKGIMEGIFYIVFQRVNHERNIFELSYRIWFQYWFYQWCSICSFRIWNWDELIFYPEYLTIFILSLFRKSPNISEKYRIRKLYKSSFKHGWSVDLHEEIFNKYYKSITEYDHMSVNYNPNINTKSIKIWTYIYIHRWTGDWK